MNIYDEEAESVVLGTLFQNADTFSDIGEYVREDDFYTESHRLIFRSFAQMIDQGTKPDIVLIASDLREKKVLEKVGGNTYLTQLASSGSLLSAESCAKKIKELSLRRSLFYHLKDLEKQVFDSDVSIEALFSKAEESISSTADRYSAHDVRHIKMLDQDFQEYIKHIKAAEGGITGLPTHFKKLDELTTGFKAGQFIVLAARPGVGKTTLALNIASQMALKSNLTVLIFSLEMSSIELLLKMVCANAFLDSSRVQKGYITDKEIHKIYQACAQIYAKQIYIDDSPHLTSWELKQRSRRLAHQLNTQGNKLDFIIVDYLQLIAEKTRAENRQVEVAHLSRTMKLIAKELHVPILVVSQMNRAIEQRGKDHKPQLSDLRESGAIEQDADTVIFIHREELYNPEIAESEKGTAELILAKHRAGPTGSVKLAFKKETNSFYDFMRDG